MATGCLLYSIISTVPSIFLKFPLKYHAWAFLIFRTPPFQAVSGLPDSSGGDRDGGHDTDSQMNSGSDAETKESSSDKYLHHVSKSSHSISKSGGGSSNKKASNKKARNR